MKKLISALFILIALAFSTGASAQGLVICQLKEKGTEKVLASVNQARLASGETCDSWRTKKVADLGLSTAGGCELLADGKMMFEGFKEVPKRGTSIVKGAPAQGQTCDQWREEQAIKLVTG